MDSRCPPNETPSQYGEPCPKGEGDETARYVTLAEELKIIGGVVLAIFCLAVLLRLYGIV